MSSATQPLQLWAGTGIELEYMIVDWLSMNVRPIADRLLQRAAGSMDMEVQRGDMAWSNELVLHVVELKTNRPVARLAGVAEAFQEQIREINAHLADWEARLMPSGMHPWMDPLRETELWPHDYAEVYRAYDRIFGCRNHGYANLQSMHLNLSFAGDDEFRRLHAACRVLLPLLPAMTASSPYADGRHAGWMDHRLETYRHNAERLPSMAGRIIPEPCYTRADYQERILAVIERDIRPLDPEGWLQPEFLNARGAIARFSRGSLEIRLMDVQEHVSADIAMAQLVIVMLRLLVEEQWCSLEVLQSAETQSLETMLDRTIRDADAAIIHDAAYLRMLGWQGAAPCTAGALWEHLVGAAHSAAHFNRKVSEIFERTIQQGPLARRLLRALGPFPDRERLQEVYRELCECLASDRRWDLRM